jgi:hypothetical protein
MKKIVLVFGLVLALSLVSVAGAQTLQEQIAALQSQLATLVAQAGGTTASVSSVPTITKSLTIGSKGDEVTALQKYLEEEALLTMPAGVDYGYFGALTKKAVVEWQKANDVSPASGYFGPISRAALEALAAAAPAPVTGTTTTPVVSGITTPGVEGTLTVTANPTPSSGVTLREGDVKKDVLGLKLEAKLSDISVQRVKVNLGASTIVYNKLFKKIYLMDGSTVLAESDLNSSTVVKDGSAYFITLTGFNVVVPKNSTKVLVLSLDAQSSIDSTYDSNNTYGLLIPADGVRGVDGAGLTQNGPSSALAIRTVTIDADALVDAATLKVSKNISGSPAAGTIVAADGTNNNEKDGITLLSFNAVAEKDAVTVTDVVATITNNAAGGATTTTAYLMDGSETVASASVVGSTATFADMDYTIPAGTTKTLALKVDVRSANGTASAIYGSISGASITAENSSGTAVIPTGSATGESLSVLSAGPEITLVSTPVITKEVTTNSTTGVSTSTATATFVVRVKALGDDVTLGRVGSGTPMFASSTAFFKIYGNEAVTAIVPSVTFNIPESGVTTVGETSTLAEGNTVDVTATVTFSSRTPAAGAVTTTGTTYAVGMEKMGYNGTGFATFMSGKSAWRTNAITMPIN